MCRAFSTSAASTAAAGVVPPEIRPTTRNWRAAREDEDRDAADEPRVDARGAREHAERGADQRRRDRDGQRCAQQRRSSVAIAAHHAGTPPQHEPPRSPYDPGVTLDPGVFKAYDVRGIVPDELDADGAYRIARAYVDQFEPTRIAVGHDMRLSSEELSEAAISGALDAGCDVDDIGLAGTEMIYFAVGEHGYEGGFTITASHNPVALQRPQDGAPRRAAGRRRLGPRPRARPCPEGRVPHAGEPRRAPAARRPRRVRRPLPVVVDPLRSRP